MEFNGLEAMWGGLISQNEYEYLNTDNVVKMLRRVVELAGMTVIAQPVVVDHTGGIDAFILLAESHAILTVKYAGAASDNSQPHHAAWFALFSCKPFNVDAITDLLGLYLGIGMRLTHTIPRSIAPAVPHG